MGSTDRDGRPDGADQVLADAEPDYLAAPAATPPTSRTISWLLASLAVVGVLAAAAIVTAARERGAPTPDGDPISEAQVAAPWDGKASMRLPVTITPNRDLVDGQEVAVSATGFPPGADLGVLMCTNAAVFAGIQACDVATALSSLKGFPITADAQGNVTTRYRVSARIAVTASGAPQPGAIRDGANSSVPHTVDCTAGDIDPDVWPSIIPAEPSADPGGFTCIIAIGMVTDYDQSGGAAVGFVGSVFRTFDTTTTTTAAVSSGVVPGSFVPTPSPAPASTPPPAPSSTVVGSTTFPPAPTTTTSLVPGEPPPPGRSSTTTTAPP